MKIIKDCYFSQAKGAKVYLQIGYTAIMIGKGTIFGRQLCLELFTHYRRFRMCIPKVQW